MLVCACNPSPGEVGTEGFTMLVCACNPSPGEVGTGRSLGLAGQQVYLNWEALGSARDLSQKNSN